MPAKSTEPVVIKKYANRRLYNTETSCYITLDDLFRMIREDTDFVVRDAKTDEDLTRTVLTQIIVERESSAGYLLPNAFLKQIISYYDTNTRQFLPPYLEASLEYFKTNQDDIQRYLQRTFGNYFSRPTQWEEMSRQNMNWFSQTVGMFSPFKFEK
jgi:polyhydroxyalkanoate synthesis repressor PhaR